MKSTSSYIFKSSVEESKKVWNVFRQRFNRVGVIQGGGTWGCFWVRKQNNHMMEVGFYVRMELKFTSSREALKVELSSGTDPKNWVAWQVMWILNSVPPQPCDYLFSCSILRANCRRDGQLQHDAVAATQDCSIYVITRIMFHNRQPIRDTFSD